MAARAAGNVGGENPQFVLREFEGMNNIAGREAINDNEFWWCENAIPVAPSALYPVHTNSPALATIASETGAPTYVINFNSAGTDYCFAVWANSGNAWIVNLTTLATTKIVTGSLISGQTSATQYNNQGLLIIDPAGYWDWNITAANTLTPQNNALALATIDPTSVTLSMGTSLKQIWAPATGTGGSVQSVYEVTSVTINAAGTGYAVGDTITLTDGSPTTPAIIVVSSIGGSGSVTGITLSTGGDYPGPTNVTLVQTGPSGTVSSTTGSGSGATFTGHMMAISVNILTRGNGYPTSFLAFDENSASHKVTQMDITSSGVIGGTAIATYAGRVWIASSRTVYFTDINSYYSFGGVGGSFTINDAYLHNNITALFSANNYLYIFGDTSIDALSNVTVSGGVTAFSRINVTTSIGTSVPTSVFGYYRALIFYHKSGFYLLAGATPQRISDKISALVQQIVSSGANFPLVYGGQVLIQGELCAAFMFTFNDVFTLIGGTRSLIALYFRNRWWVASQSNLSMQAMISVSLSGASTAGFWAGNSFYEAFAPTAALGNWLITTKLWDGGSPTHEKQSINAAIAGQWVGLIGSTGITINVDTELASAPGQALSVPSAGYSLEVTVSNEGGSQYLGLTVTGSTDMTQIRMLALRGKAERDMMQ